MRIGVIMRRPRAAHATPMTDAIAQLAADGASVELLHPSESPIDLSRVRVAHDLYVLKEKTDLTLSTAATPYISCGLVQNILAPADGRPTGCRHAMPPRPGGSIRGDPARALQPACGRVSRRRSDPNA